MDETTTPPDDGDVSNETDDHPAVQLSLDGEPTASEPSSDEIRANLVDALAHADAAFVVTANRIDDDFVAVGDARFTADELAEDEGTTLMEHIFAKAYDALPPTAPMGGLVAAVDLPDELAAAIAKAAMGVGPTDDAQDTDGTETDAGADRTYQ